MPDPTLRKQQAAPAPPASQEPPVPPGFEDASYPAGFEDAEYPGDKSINYNKIGKGQPSNLDKVVQGGKDLFAGAGAGAFKTATGAYDLVRKLGPTRAPTMSEVVSGAKERQPMLPPHAPIYDELSTAPKSIPGMIGNTVEQMGELYALPGEGLVEGGINLASKASKLARLGPTATKVVAGATRAGIDAAQGFGVRAVQTGGDWKDAAETGATFGGLSAAGSVLGETIPKVKAAISQKMAPRQNTFVTRLAQALRLGPSNIEFSRDAMQAGALIKDEEALLGTKIGQGADPEMKGLPPSATQGVDDLLTLSNSAKRRKWAQYESLAGPRAAQPIDHSPIADAMEQTIPKDLLREASGPSGNPAVQQAKNDVQMLRNKADIWRQNISLKDSEEILQSINARLAAYEAKYPDMQRRALKTNPETASLVAMADALRDVQYKALEQIDDGGEAVRQIKREYGSLSAFQNLLIRQKVKMMKEAAPGNVDIVDLVNNTVRGAAAGGTVGALVGHPISGSGVGAAEGVRESLSPLVRNFLGKNRSDKLLVKAFEDYEGRGVPTGPTKAEFTKARWGADKRLNSASSPAGQGTTVPDVLGRPDLPPNSRIPGSLLPEPRVPGTGVGTTPVSRQLPPASSPAGQGTTVPDVSGRPDLPPLSRVPGRLLEAPKPGEAPVNVLPPNSIPNSGVNNTESGRGIGISEVGRDAKGKVNIRGSAAATPGSKKPSPNLRPAGGGVQMSGIEQPVRMGAKGAGGISVPMQPEDFSVKPVESIPQEGTFPAARTSTGSKQHFDTRKDSIPRDLLREFAKRNELSESDAESMLKEHGYKVDNK